MSLLIETIPILIQLVGFKLFFDHTILELSCTLPSMSYSGNVFPHPLCYSYSERVVLLTPILLQSHSRLPFLPHPYASQILFLKRISSTKSASSFPRFWQPSDLSLSVIIYLEILLVVSLPISQLQSCFSARIFTVLPELLVKSIISDRHSLARILLWLLMLVLICSLNKMCLCFG
jgi:hypothetical protein